MGSFLKLLYILIPSFPSSKFTSSSLLGFFLLHDSSGVLIMDTNPFLYIPICFTNNILYGVWCFDDTFRLGSMVYSFLKHRRLQRMKKMKGWRKKMRMKRKEGKRA